MLSDTESHAIELKVLPKPHFEGGKKVAVQQGAGMAVAKTTDAEVEASVFSSSGSPNRKTTSHLQWVPAICRDHAANDMDAIYSSGLALTGNMENCPDRRPWRL